jgi:hypothetical protein
LAASFILAVVGIVSITHGASIVHYFRRDDFGTGKLFPTGKAFVAVSPDFTTLLRRVVFICELTFRTGFMEQLSFKTGLLDWRIRHLN